jgi:hypothetical protein
MNNVESKTLRPIPLMLVLLLLAAGFLSFAMQYLVQFVFMYWIRPTTSSMLLWIPLLSQAFSFPFWQTCVVWLAARNGKTGWETWTVPSALIATLLVVPVVWWLLYSFFYGISRMSLGGILYWQLSSHFREFLFSVVLMSLAFRVSTLHLRPVNEAASPHRLTVLFLLFLTGAVAIGMCADVLAYQQVIAMNWGGPAIQTNMARMLTTFLHDALTVLLWLSAAWLFVADNPKRWFGGIGLVFYWILLGLYFFLVLPTLIFQQSSPAVSNASLVSFQQLAGSFAISVFHVAIVFLCVGMMHMAGYRWDIRRRLKTELGAKEILIGGAPPLMRPEATAVNHQVTISVSDSV